jgi:hypothetical protein
MSRAAGATWPGRLEYRTLPVPAILAHTILLEAGAVTFGIEYRQLDEAAILREYGPDSRAKFDGRRPAGMAEVVAEDGLALHVFDTRSGDEVLRFDCFEKAPHWHLLAPAISRNVVIEHDAAAHGPMLDWALRALATDLAGLLRSAGARGLAHRLDPERVAAALTSVGQTARYVAATGRPVQVEG